MSPIRLNNSGVQPASTSPAQNMVAPAQPVAPVAAPVASPTGAEAGMPAPQVAAAPQEAAAPRGFQLPDLGAPPDPNDPQYQGETGQAVYKADLHEYTHKQMIHDSVTKLDALLRQLHPTRDFQKEYDDEIAAQKEHEAERPKDTGHAVGLKRAALALGDMNPAVRESNLGAFNENLAGEQKQSDTSFSQRMLMKQKMHEAAAAQAQQEGDWKKALAEKQQADLISDDTESLKNDREMAKTKTVIEGQNKRAQIKADEMRNTAEMRMHSVAAGHGLSGNFEQQFLKEAAKNIAKLLGPHDLTKTYDATDLDSISQMLEDLGHRYENAQTGHTSAPAPAHKPAAKAAGKEDF